VVAWRNCAIAPRLIRPRMWEYVAVLYLYRNSRDSFNGDIVYLLGDRDLMFKHYLDELRQWWGQKKIPFSFSVFVMRRKDCKFLTKSLLFVDLLYIQTVFFILNIPPHISISLEIASAEYSSTYLHLIGNRFHRTPALIMFKFRCNWR
jgi:hypothetical protein